MLCAFVHMPVKAAAQNQMVHLELRHFARYALMTHNYNIGSSVNAVLAQQLQRSQQQHDRQQHRTTLQQRRRNHPLLGTQELLWVRDKPKPHSMYVCIYRYQRNDQVVSSADNVVPNKTRVRVSAPLWVWASRSIEPHTHVFCLVDKICPCV